jgi:hypothetical protein
MNTVWICSNRGDAVGRGAGDELSLRRHEHRERDLDELLVTIDRLQGAAHIVGNLGISSLLDPICQLHDGGLEGELVLVDLEK